MLGKHRGYWAHTLSQIPANTSQTVMPVGLTYLVLLAPQVCSTPPRTSSSADLFPLGCAVITRTEAFMFTDGRYFLQAAEQMGE